MGFAATALEARFEPLDGLRVVERAEDDQAGRVRQFGGR
jgi:hypothetical protein